MKGRVTFFCLALLWMDGEFTLAKSCKHVLEEEHHFDLEKGILSKNPSIRKALLRRRLKALRDSEDIGYFDHVSIKGKSYPLISFLGSGVEGSVYQVVGQKNKIQTIKLFGELSDLKKHVTQMKGLKKRNIPAVEIFDVDEENLAVLQGYVEGFTIEELARVYRHIGISQEQYLRIREKDDQLLGRLEDIGSRSSHTSSLSYLSYRDYNVLYELRSRRLVVIDGF